MKHSSGKRMVVVGGGAAGFFTAINLAENQPEAEVIILEGSGKLLTKVRVSGGGRCNVTHNCFDVNRLLGNYPRGHKELRGPFNRFQPQDVIEWFESRGVALKTEKDGRMFSITDKSQTVIDCFMDAAAQAGVKVRKGCRVVKICPLEGKGLYLELHKGEGLECDAALLATGSAPGGLALARSLGHKIVSPVPSLFTFKVHEDRRLEGMAGVSVPEAELKLRVSGSQKIFSQSGPLLVTHWGLSGPAILKLSAWAARELFESSYEAGLQINWTAGVSCEEMVNIFNNLRKNDPGRQMSRLAPESVPRRFWLRILEESEVPPELPVGQLPKKKLLKVAAEITEGKYRVEGKGVFKEEFVTCGGIDLKEVDFRTMESRVCPGLYFAGEILNIDGVTGGFNFQNAWTTGWIASKNMAHRIEKQH